MYNHENEWIFVLHLPLSQAYCIYFLIHFTVNKDQLIVSRYVGVFLRGLLLKSTASNCNNSKKTRQTQEAYKCNDVHSLRD